MEWVESPESSSIVGFGYDERLQILAVEFASGGRYNYYDVPPAVFEQMKLASSKGRFVTQNVKGAYRYARTVPD